MKKINFIAMLLSLLSIAFVSSCSKDGGDDAKPSDVSSINITSSSSFTIESAASSVEVVIKYQGDLKYSSDADWITVTQKSNADGVCTYAIAASENTGSERKANIIFSVSEKKRPVTITQKAFGTTNSNGDISGIKFPTQGEIPMLGMGWNLGNQFDAWYMNGDKLVSGETAWGQPKCTQATFDALAKAGFASVRIPITWAGHFDENNKIDEDFLNRVYEVVGYAKNAGLKAIINMHHDGAANDKVVQQWLNIVKASSNADDGQKILKTYTDLWRQIAEKFKDEGDYLIFESYNEIHDGGWGYHLNLTDGGKQYNTLNEWAQAFVDVVREVGGENATRYLGIAGYCTNADLTMEHLKIPTDKVNGKILIAIHSYDPHGFTAGKQYNEWGHTGKNKASGSDEDYIANLCARLKAKYIDNGYPVYFGEMGCEYKANTHNFRKYYSEYFAKCCRIYGISALYWDNGNTSLKDSQGHPSEAFGIINHGTGAWLTEAKGEEIANAMIKGMNENSEDYTIQSVYDSAPQK